MKTILNDEQVIRLYLNTKPNDCFETLYNRYVKKVYSRCYSLTKDADKAHDYTQDIFVKVFARLNDFKGRSTFSTWLYSVSYNYCMDQLRGASRTMTMPLADTMEEWHATGTEEAELREQQLQQLAHAMTQLSSQESMLLQLKYQEGLEIREIALQLDINECAVKMRLKRSRDKVRRLCDQNMGRQQAMA